MRTFFAGPRTAKTLEAPALPTVHARPVPAIALAASVRNCRRVTAKLHYLRRLDLACPDLVFLLLAGLAFDAVESVRRGVAEGCVAGGSGGFAGISDFAKRGSSASRVAS